MNWKNRIFYCGRKNSWLDNICNILRHPYYKKVTGSLAIFNDLEEVIGKCALGEISCRVGIKLTKENSAFIKYGKIMETARVPFCLREGKILPEINYANTNDFNSINVEDFPSEYGGADLEWWIYTLNDAGLKYNEIADFLETTFGDMADD